MTHVCLVRSMEVKQTHSHGRRQRKKERRNEVRAGRSEAEMP